MTGAKTIMAGGPWLGTDVNVSLDRRALVKGWVVAVGIWLLAGMGLILTVELSLNEVFAGPTFLGSFFPLFAAVSVGLALVAGAPGAMALAWLLRPVRAKWCPVAVFYLLPTLLLAIPVGFAANGNPQATLAVGSVLGVCSAAGRAAVIHDEPDIAA